VRGDLCGVAVPTGAAGLRAVVSLLGVFNGSRCVGDRRVSQLEAAAVESPASSRDGHAELG